MNFLTARQPFVPAILTLILLMTIGLWHGQEVAYTPASHSEVIEQAAPESEPSDTTEQTAPESELSEEVTLTAQELMIRMPGAALADWQNNHPSGSRWVSALLILLTGICIGRLPLDMNIYGISTCLGIPLFGILLCCTTGRIPSLDTLITLVLLASIIRRYSRTYRNGYCFDELFHASLYLGALIMIRPSAWLILLILPIVCLFFRRTLRETAVALCGMLIVPALICYINWGCGGSFLAPWKELQTMCLSGTPVGLFRAENQTWIITLVALSLLNVFGVLSILVNLFAVGSKARSALLLQMGLWLLTTLLLCAPSATLSDIALITIPSAALLPFFLVRIHPLLFSILYASLLTTSICRIFL